MQSNENVLEVQGLQKYFPAVRRSPSQKKQVIKAVDNVSLSIKKGETYGLVGESGCGKSTLGRCILRLEEPSSGAINICGLDFTKIKGDEMRKMRRNVQIVFQDPFLSLDPKQRIGNILEEALAIHNIGNAQSRFEIVINILEKVGLRSEHFYRYPHEFSGGQRQRIGLARALILEPKLIICDEPVSALDVSVQAQIINLLEKIQKDTRVSYLFITHNMSVVKHISKRVGVMYLGHLVEEAETEELFNNPRHPYTRALLSAVAPPNPHLRKKHIALKGEMPSPLDMPTGCVFSTRCPRCQAECLAKRPEFLQINGLASHKVACFYAAKEDRNVNSNND